MFIKYIIWHFELEKKLEIILGKNETYFYCVTILEHTFLVNHILKSSDIKGAIPFTQTTNQGEIVPSLIHNLLTIIKNFN